MRLPLFPLAAAAALLLAAGGAHAQLRLDGKPEQPLAPPPPAAAISGVEVIAPKIVERTPYGVVSREVSLSVRVPYGDLDMSTPAGVAALDKRVAEAADYACTQLDKMYANTTPETFYCIKYAVKDAQPQVIQARASR